MARSAVRSRVKTRPLRAAPPALNIRAIINALKEAAIKIHRDNCVGLAKEAAFSFILSFFPMLLVFITLFFIWGDAERSVTEILITFRRTMPADSFKIVENY